MKTGRVYRGSVRPNNKLDGQWESLQDGSKASNDHRFREMGSEESKTRISWMWSKCVDIVEMCRVNKLDRIRNERNRVTAKMGEISKKVQESMLKS